MNTLSSTDIRCKGMPCSCRIRDATKRVSIRYGPAIVKICICDECNNDHAIFKILKKEHGIIIEQRRGETMAKNPISLLRELSALRLPGEPGENKLSGKIVKQIILDSRRMLAQIDCARETDPYDCDMDFGNGQSRFFDYDMDAYVDDTIDNFLERLGG